MLECRHNLVEREGGVVYWAAKSVKEGDSAEKGDSVAD